MSLVPSSSFAVANQTLHKTSLPGDDYVLSLTRITNAYAASASSPSNRIYLFDRATLQNTGVLKGHEHATTQMCAVSRLGASNRETLLSSGKDGCVMAWDERSGSVGIKMDTGRIRPLLCCDASVDGSLVAAGTVLEKEDAFIIYWDPRNPAARLRSHDATHSDDITAVRFLKSEHAPNSHNVLLSTSSDGLVSISSALEADEDEAVLHVGNWGCSISQGGWISDARETPCIWAASDMETFSCWSNELDQLLTADIRRPSLHDQGHTWVTDYLITGHSTRKAESGLGVFVGSNEGDVALITSNDLSDAIAPWAIHSVWAGGHSGIVRSLYWDEEHDVLVTGGEDSKVVAWRIREPMTPDQLYSPMESEVPNSKREWDDGMDGDNRFLGGSKRVRR